MVDLAIWWLVKAPLWQLEGAAFLAVNVLLMCSFPWRPRKSQYTLRRSVLRDSIPMSLSSQGSRPKLLPTAIDSHT